MSSCLTQTGKTKRLPIILVHEPFWKDLLAWFKNYLLHEKMIDAKDLDLFHMVNTAEEVLPIIEEFYRGSPSPATNVHPLAL
jgi:predicted Rossmann-fold nucleotide-binding protein